MFGGSFDLTILSGPLALTGLISGKAVLVVWLCEGDLVCGSPQVLPDRRHRQLCRFFGQPELSGGASSCQSIAQSLKQALGDQPAPAFSWARRDR
ncbi:MAG: hypothetical protein GDA36_08965 [Rhodobacteraceae bacterium]|nr:hypothetical protein [Paracoccaceae bacterium]